MRFSLLLAAFLLAAPIAPLAAQSGPPVGVDTVPPLFHQGYSYGSQSLFSPLTVILNKGFDIFQLGRSRDPWSFPYRNGIVHVIGDAIRNPGAAIERDPGWNQWIRTEVLPLSIGDARWVPNWTEHFLGGGITYRALADWYEARGAPVPLLLAGLTTMSASVLNEILEFPHATQASSSTVADLLIFDVGGILFFTWEPAARWTARNLLLADWSTIASFTFPNRELQNNGQYLVLKAPLPVVDQKLFVRFGLGVQFGLTTPLSEGRAISAALGLDTRGRQVDPATGREYIDMMFGGGLYYDRNNSLLASISASAAVNMVSLNLYPGLVGGPLRDVGAWAVWPRDRPIRVGLVHRRLLGTGLGWGGP